MSKCYGVVVPVFVVAERLLEVLAKLEESRLDFCWVLAHFGLAHPSDTGDGAFRQELLLGPLRGTLSAPRRSTGRGTCRSDPFGGLSDSLSPVAIAAGDRRCDRGEACERQAAQAG